MGENFKNYKFLIIDVPQSDKENAYHQVKIYIEKDNNEVYLISKNGGGNYSIYLQDRFFNLNVDNETKNISAFEGELLQKSLKFAGIEYPKQVKNVILKLDSNENLLQGSGSYIEFEDTKIYYDKIRKILQIGNWNVNNESYRFFENAFAQLKEGKLTGLLFTEIEI